MLTVNRRHNARLLAESERLRANWHNVQLNFFDNRRGTALVRLVLLQTNSVIELEEVSLILLAHVLEVLAHHALHDLFGCLLKATRVCVILLVWQAWDRVALKELQALSFELHEARRYLAYVSLSSELKSVFGEVNLGWWRQVRQ